MPRGGGNRVSALAGKSGLIPKGVVMALPQLTTMSVVSRCHGQGVVGELISPGYL